MKVSVPDFLQIIVPVDTTRIFDVEKVVLDGREKILFAMICL